MKVARINVVRIAHVAVMPALVVDDHGHWEQRSRRCLVCCEVDILATMRMLSRTVVGKPVDQLTDE